MQELKDELKKVLKEELEKSETKSNFHGKSWENQMPPNYHGWGHGMNAPIQMTLPLQPQNTSGFNGDSRAMDDSKTQRSVAIGLAVVVGFIGASLWLNYQKAK